MTPACECSWRRAAHEPHQCVSPPNQESVLSDSQKAPSGSRRLAHDTHRLLSATRGRWPSFSPGQPAPAPVSDGPRSPRQARLRSFRVALGIEPIYLQIGTSRVAARRVVRFQKRRSHAPRFRRSVEAARVVAPLISAFLRTRSYYSPSFSLLRLSHALPQPGEGPRVLRLLAAGRARARSLSGCSSGTVKCASSASSLPRPSPRGRAWGGHAGLWVSSAPVHKLPRRLETLPRASLS